MDNNYKYPYIEDHDLFCAVSYACKLIRENGWYNKDTERAARYYHVDVSDVRREVSRRANAGRKAKPQTKKQKYRYYIVAEEAFIGDSFEGSVSYPKVIKATSYENAAKRYSASDHKRTIHEAYGGNYEPLFSHSVYGGKSGYGSREEAEADIPKVLDELKLDPMFRDSVKLMMKARGMES